MPSKGAHAHTNDEIYGRRVLVVDDEERIAELVCDLLCQEGFEAEAVESGEDALLALTERRFDLLVTDLNMAGMSGLDLLWLRAKDIPAILMSASEPRGLLRQLLILNASWLKKPFAAEELLGLVATAPGRSWFTPGPLNDRAS
jgi:two-component system, response regulator FlrC